MVGGSTVSSNTASFARVGADLEQDDFDSRRRPSQAPFDPGSGAMRDEKLNRLEAVLLLAKEPLHPRKLSKFANLADGTEALTLVGRLNHLYDRAGRAFRVEEVAGGWQLRTRPQFGDWLRRLQHVPNAMRLSTPAIETLAVVAYRQPVVRVDIEAVRGVACGEILRQLMERDLVRVSGRSDELGRPYFYSTTQRFLQLFGLRSLDELPRAEWFREMLAAETGDGTDALADVEDRHEGSDVALDENEWDEDDDEEEEDQYDEDDDE